jgi:hypothetical protein
MAKQSLKRNLINRVRPIVLQANQKLGNYQDVVWLIGSGRSGTTWVSDMLNYQRGYREMIEPFRPLLIDQMRFLSLNQYVRPGDDFPELDKVAGAVFSGRFTHPDVDSASKRFLYNGLLIKDVFANLFAYHLCQRFPHVKPALLIRNPFEVALSKHKKSNWNWTTDPRDFLKQPQLVEDFLEPFAELIERIGASDDPIAKHIAVWCVINYVPLKQFAKDELHVLFYEDVVENTNAEVNRFWQALSPERQKQSATIPENILQKPSAVSTELSSQADKKNSPWRAKLSDAQYKTGMEVLEVFGFGDLYQNDTPDHRVLDHFLRG